MKKYIFCEAWRQYKLDKWCVLKGLKKDGRSLKQCLRSVHATAKMLKSAGFDFSIAWCNK